MKRGAGVAVKRRVALAVMTALAVHPSLLFTRVDASSFESKSPTPTATVGSLLVESEPAGAAIYVDGLLTGHTPLSMTSLSAGDHRVRLQKDGYLENARVVAVGGK